MGLQIVIVSSGLFSFSLLGDYSHAQFAGIHPRFLATATVAGCMQVFDPLLQIWRFDDFPLPTLVPRPSGIFFTLVAYSGRVVEVFTDQSWSRRDIADCEAVFAQALERRGEGFHVSNFSRHQEL